MAGSFLDDLVDALSSGDEAKRSQTRSLVDALSSADSGDETPSSGDEDKDAVQSPLVDAEDYLRRLVHMGASSAKRSDPDHRTKVASLPPPDILPQMLDSGVLSPEEKLDYYKRMVQMHETMRAGGYRSVYQIAKDGPADSVTDTDGGEKAKSSQGPQVCSEFQNSGDCKSGMACAFVHEGAFRRSEAPHEDAKIPFDPEDFIRRALQLRQQGATAKAAAK